MYFWTNNSNAMTIKANHNVGIGTTDPLAKLQVDNPGQGEFAGGNSSAGGGSHLMLRDEGSTSRTLMSGPSVVFQTPASSDGTSPWATSRLLVSPAAAGSARGTFSIQVRDQYDPLNDGTSWNWRTALTAINTGKVGIGTNSPNTTLEVNGVISTTTSDYVQGTTGSRLLLDTPGSGNTHSYIQAQSSGGTSSAEDLALQLYGGSVGIAKSNPTYKLDVAGNGRFTSTVTATNFILSSDKRLKTNIKEIDTNYIDVNWKNFELKSEPGIKRAGVIAQELEEKHPEFVSTDDEGMKSVAYIDLLITKIAELEARLEKAGI
jgi:hypothetical protein